MTTISMQDSKQKPKHINPAVEAQKWDLSPLLASQQTAHRDAAMDISTNNLHTLKSLTREISVWLGEWQRHLPLLWHRLSLALTLSLSLPSS